MDGAKSPSPLVATCFHLLGFGGVAVSARFSVKTARLLRHPHGIGGRQKRAAAVPALCELRHSLQVGVEVSTWPRRPFPVKSGNSGSEEGQPPGWGPGENRQDGSQLCECGGSLQRFYDFPCNSFFICEVTDGQGCRKPRNTSSPCPWWFTSVWLGGGPVNVGARAHG